MNLGSAIDNLFDLRQQKAKLDKKVTDLKKIIEEAELNVQGLLRENNVTLSRGEFATASITETIVPVVDDWDAFYDHILQTEGFHLLERRPASRAYRELLEAGEDVPGLRPFTKHNLSLRKN